MLTVDQRSVGPVRGGGVAIVAPSTPVSNRADSISKRQRFEIFKRDGFMCLYCGRKPPEVVLQIDHVIPKSKGGTSDESNLVTCCQDCNGGKSNIPLSHIPHAHVQSIEVRQEKLDQLRAIAEQARIDVEVQEELFGLISDHWMALVGDDPDEYSIAGPLGQSVRRFLKMLPLPEVLEAVDITFRSCKSKSDYQRHKYFCGVCWRKFRERNHHEPVRTQSDNWVPCTPATGTSVAQVEGQAPGG